MSKAFTLIELLVVTSIILLFTSLLVPNYRAGNNQLALQRSASRLAQDLRRAQEMAMSAREVAGGVPSGFGVYFNITEPSYIVFADTNNNQQRGVGDIDLESVSLESQIIVSNLSPTSSFSVVFVPPDPIVWINGVSSGVTAQITLAIRGDLSNNMVIFTNNAGLIAIQ